MTPPPAHARHLALLRRARAAGQSFGCLDEAGPARGPRRAVLGVLGALAAVAAVAVAVAAAALALLR